IAARSKDMNRPAITGDGRVRRSPITKLEGDPAGPIDEHLELFFVPPAAQCVGEFFIYAEIWKALQNLREAAPDGGSGRGSKKRGTYPDLPDQGRSAQI